MTTDEKCRIVYEFYMGNCWHEDHMGEWFFADRHCMKCDTECLSNPNPPLATSLDAWRPIWEAMTDEQANDYTDELVRVLQADGLKGWAWTYLATAMHHLEAALTAIGGE